MLLRQWRREDPVTSLRRLHSLKTRLTFSSATPAIAARSAGLIFSWNTICRRAGTLSNVFRQLEQRARYPRLHGEEGCGRQGLIHLP